MKIYELYKINTLKEKALILVNNDIDNEFYDYFMFKDVTWLLENEEKITSDFEKNKEKLKYYTIMNSNFIDKSNFILSLKNVDIEEFSSYINYIPYSMLNNKVQKEIEDMFKTFKSFKSKYDCLIYFERIKRR